MNRNSLLLSPLEMWSNQEKSRVENGSPAQSYTSMATTLKIVDMLIDEIDHLKSRVGALQGTASGQAGICAGPLELTRELEPEYKAQQQRIDQMPPTGWKPPGMRDIKDGMFGPPMRLDYDTLRVLAAAAILAPRASNEIHASPGNYEVWIKQSFVIAEKLIEEGMARKSHV